jgi:hypothetical protein
MIKTDLYTMLQILSITLFEKMPLNQLFRDRSYNDEDCAMRNQLNLFDNLTGQ